MMMITNVNDIIDDDNHNDDDNDDDNDSDNDDDNDDDNEIYQFFQIYNIITKYNIHIQFRNCHY